MPKRFAVKREGLYWGTVDGRTGFLVLLASAAYIYERPEAEEMARLSGGVVVELESLGRYLLKEKALPDGVEFVG